MSKLIINQISHSQKTLQNLDIVGMKQKQIILKWNEISKYEF